jgi:hypothetical protein
LLALGERRRQIFGWRSFIYFGDTKKERMDEEKGEEARTEGLE